MGRPKQEMKLIHRKKTKKTEGKVKLYRKNEIPYSKLTKRAKHLLEKRDKQRKKPV